MTPTFAESTATAATQGAQGSAEAELEQGRAYQLGQGLPQDFIKAAAFYRQAAAQGNAKAMHNLGVIYLNGQGVPKNGAMAAQWFQQAANLGLPASELQIGLFYFFGDMGIAQNYEASARWLSLASRQKGDAQSAAQAANALGAMNEHGFGMPVNGNQAVWWYTQGAEAGNIKAQFNLGRVYAEGNLTKQDKVQAYMWLKLAAFQGDQMSLHLLPEYLAGREFSSAEMAEGDRRVRDYHAKHHILNSKPLVIPPTPTAPGQRLPAD